MTERAFRGIWLGTRPYAEVHRLQNELQEARKRAEIGDTVLFVEHAPVITLGRGARAEHVLLPEGELSARGIAIAITERGGEVTLHAPGQLVCYPILDLMPDRCDVRRYVRHLTSTMQKLARDFGVDGGTLENLIGLWVDRRRINEWPGEALAAEPAKLGAIGVHLSRWVTKHGFALNLTTDLRLFDLIVPCGTSTLGVTSIQELTGSTPSVAELSPRALELLARQLDATIAAYTDASQVAALTISAICT